MKAKLKTYYKILRLLKATKYPLHKEEFAKATGFKSPGKKMQQKLPELSLFCNNYFTAPEVNGVYHFQTICVLLSIAMAKK